MMVIDLGEPIAPLGAGQPFHQALKRMGAGHRSWSLPRIAGCCRSNFVVQCIKGPLRVDRWPIFKPAESTGFPPRTVLPDAFPLLVREPNHSTFISDRKLSAILT